MPTCEVAEPEVGVVKIIDSDSKTSGALEWKVVLYNDDVNSFEHVIDCLMKILHMTKEKAEKAALNVHTEGRDIVWFGHKERCEAYAAALQHEGLSASIEQ